MMVRGICIEHGMHETVLVRFQDLHIALLHRCLEHRVPDVRELTPVVCCLQEPVYAVRRSAKAAVCSGFAGSNVKDDRHAVGQWVVRDAYFMKCHCIYIHRQLVHIAVPTGQALRAPAKESYHDQCWLCRPSVFFRTA